MVSNPPTGWWLGLHQPPWSFGFDSQTRGTSSSRSSSPHADTTCCSSLPHGVLGAHPPRIRGDTQLPKPFETSRLSPLSGPTTHPANRDLEGGRNASPPGIFFKFFFNCFESFQDFLQKNETIHPESAGFYVRKYFLLLVLTDYYPSTHICT